MILWNAIYICLWILKDRVKIAYIQETLLSFKYEDLLSVLIIMEAIPKKKKWAHFMVSFLWLNDWLK